MDFGQASSRLSGQAVQMNPGNSHGVPQQQQPQVAPGNPGPDQFLLLRKITHQKIVKAIAEKQNLSSVTPKLVQLAMQVEGVFFKKYPTMADYYAIAKRPIDVLLHHAAQSIVAEGRRRQQLSEQVASGSSYGTMIPTPVIAQSENGTSVASHSMDTRFTGGNSTTGSMYSGHHNPSTNIPLNSTSGGISVDTTSEGMQRLRL